MSFLAKWKDEGLLSSTVFEKLNAFTNLLLHWNSRVNLTGLVSTDSIEEILIGESILAARVFPLSGKRVLDVGSGAGIPGLIWLICDPTIQLTSLEIRTRKVAFQKEVIRLLQLPAEILCGRFPDAVSNRKFDVVATRAVRFDSKWLPEATGVLAEGGRLLRFSASGAVDSGWRSVPVSKRSALWIR